MELILLKFSESNSLRQRNLLQRLDLAAELGVQARNEIAQKEGMREPDGTVGQALKVREVIIDGTSLLELEQGAMWIIVV